MKITQIQYFVTVCELGSISGAARQLKVTQPGISGAIAALEKEFGVRLFHRESKKLSPTKEGMDFLFGATRMLEEYYKVDTLLRELGKGQKLLRIGVPGRTSGVVGPTLLADYGQAHPRVTLEIDEYPSVDIARHLLNGDIDIGFAVDRMVDTMVFDALLLLSTQMVFCVHKQNPLAQHDIISFEEIGRFPIVALKGGNYKNNFFEAGFREAGIEPNILLYTNQIHTIKRFIQKDLAGSFLFPQNIDAYDNIAMRPFGRGVEFHITLLTRKGSANAEVADFLRYAAAYRFEEGGAV